MKDLGLLERELNMVGYYLLALDVIIFFSPFFLIKWEIIFYYAWQF